MTGVLHITRRLRSTKIASKEMPMSPMIRDIRTRLFRAEDAPLQTPYANPMAGWLGQSGDHPLPFRFPEWLVVEVELDSGVIGIGNAGLQPRLASQIILDTLKPLVIGRSVANLEDNWQRMYRATVAWGRRGIGMAAISAVDIAFWDAWARTLREPVYNLLGGRKSTSIQVYASRLYGDDPDLLAEEAIGYVGQGFTMLKQRFVYGPADGLPGLRRNRELVAAVRNAIGDAVDLAVDAYQGWNLDYALRMVRQLADLDLRWVEEPLLPDDVAGYRHLRARSPVPISGGEHEFTLTGVKDLLLDERAVDVLQFDTNRVGGITVARKACAIAEAVGVPVIPHAGQQHNYHLVISQPCAPMAEYFPPGPIDVGNEMHHQLFTGEPVAQDGQVVLSEEPGLGLTVKPSGAVREIEPRA